MKPSDLRSNIHNIIPQNIFFTFKFRVRIEKTVSVIFISYCNHIRVFSYFLHLKITENTRLTGVWTGLDTTAILRIKTMVNLLALLYFDQKRSYYPWMNGLTFVHQMMSWNFLKVFTFPPKTENENWNFDLHYPNVRIMEISKSAIADHHLKRWIFVNLFITIEMLTN